MQRRAITAVQDGVRAALVGGAVQLFSWAQYTPFSKWMTVSLMTVERLDGRRL